MARERSPSRDLAFELWKNSNGKLALKEIANQLNVSDSQIRKWKNVDDWEGKLNSNVTIANGNDTNQFTFPIINIFPLSNLRIGNIQLVRNFF